MFVQCMMSDVNWQWYFVVNFLINREYFWNVLMIFFPCNLYININGDSTKVQARWSSIHGSHWSFSHKPVVLALTLYGKTEEVQNIRTLTKTRKKKEYIRIIKKTTNRISSEKPRKPCPTLKCYQKLCAHDQYFPFLWCILICPSMKEIVVV